jgi:hypothetical protein
MAEDNMDNLFTTRLMNTLRSIDNTKHADFPKHPTTTRPTRLCKVAHRCRTTSTAMTSIAMCILAAIIILLVCVIGYMLLCDGDDDRVLDTDRR